MFVKRGGRTGGVPAPAAAASAQNVNVSAVLEQRPPSLCTAATASVDAGGTASADR